MQADSRKPLWDNISALMKKKYGGENLNRLAREGGFSPATATRLKGQQTSVGLDTLDRLAAIFDVQAHELIDPEFDPMTTHAAKLSPSALDLGHMLDSIPDQAMQQRAYALAMQVIQFGLAPTVAPAAPPSAAAEPQEPSRASAPTPSPLQNR